MAAYARRSNLTYVYSGRMLRLKRIKAAYARGRRKQNALKA